MSIPVALLLLALPYLVWFGVVIGVIKLDQAARARRAAASPELSGVMFEDTSVTPYLLLSLICGALVLPVYFGATRRSVGGFLIGLGVGALALFLTGAVATLTNVIAVSIYHERLF